MTYVLSLVLFESYGWSSLLIVLLVLACPLGMWIMMRGKRGGNGSENSSSKRPTQHRVPEDRSREE